MSDNPSIPPELPGLEASLLEALAPLGFVRHPDRIDGHNVRAAWTRKTWNTNRGVVLVDLPVGEAPGTWAQALKLPVGKQLGYLPFLYGIGLQVVLIGDSEGVEEAALKAHVDRYDNQRSILQSLHLFDRAGGRRVSARTWGQVVTGRFQDAIEGALDGLIRSSARPEVRG